MIPNRNKTLVGLPRQDPPQPAEPEPEPESERESVPDYVPFDLRPRLAPLTKHDTWPSRPTPTDLPRACRLEVTAQIVRRQRASWAEFGLSCAIVWVVGCLLLALVMP